MIQVVPVGEGSGGSPFCHKRSWFLSWEREAKMNLLKDHGKDTKMGEESLVKVKVNQDPHHG